MKYSLNLIEPTLFDQTGHGYGYTKTLIEASSALNISPHIWLDKRGGDLFLGSNCQAHLFFSRKFRQCQKILLYYQLLKKNANIYICTSELLDLIILDFIKRFFRHSKSTVFCHFHPYSLV